MGHAALLASAGVVTAIPLLFFAAAARRVPLTVMGLLQYLAPVMQFLTGVLIYNEPMPAPRLAGFVLVWLALVLLTIDGLRTRHRTRRERGTQPARRLRLAGVQACRPPQHADRARSGGRRVRWCG